MASTAVAPTRWPSAFEQPGVVLSKDGRATSRRKRQVDDIKKKRNCPQNREQKGKMQAPSSKLWSLLWGKILHCFMKLKHLEWSIDRHWNGSDWHPSHPITTYHRISPHFTFHQISPHIITIALSLLPSFSRHISIVNIWILKGHVIEKHFLTRDCCTEATRWINQSFDWKQRLRINKYTIESMRLQESHCGCSHLNMLAIQCCHCWYFHLDKFDEFKLNSGINLTQTLKSKLEMTFHRPSVRGVHLPTAIAPLKSGIGSSVMEQFPSSTSKLWKHTLEISNV